MVIDMMESYRKRMSLQGNTIGQSLKIQSDMIMEQSWDNDISSKVCYIYDYFHDDQPMLNSEMTYNNTTKTRIDVKFFKTTKTSLNKDQVEYKIMFKPSQKIKFVEGEELYYYETDYKNVYFAEFPIGCFIDIPDDKGIYNKWLICAKEISNQFVNYLVLPCNYHLHWIEDNGYKRTKRKMWCVLRSQSSYNSGLWSSDVITTPENQNIIWLPINNITDKLFYVYKDGSKENQRLIISAPTKNPIVWKISKIENTKPFGLQKITVAQDLWNPNTDYIDEQEQSQGDIFAMYADYNSSPVEPVDDETIMDVICNITTNVNVIKVKGSYKLLTAKITDENGVDVTTQYLTDNYTWEWTCSIEDVDKTNDEFITWLTQSVNNQIKIKVGIDRSYISKILDVVCTIKENEEEVVNGNIQLSISAL